MRTPIFVCRRNDGGHRDRLWEFCKDWWQQQAADLEIIEGHHDDGLFSRAAAFNTASRIAGSWDACLVIDADIILGDIQQAYDALDLALETGKMVFAHNHRFGLNEATTERLIAGEWEFDIDALRADAPLTPRLLLEDGDRPMGSYGPTFSSCQAITRQLWEDIGGWDERCRGWGVEDGIFRLACDALRDGSERLKGNVIHLWHPRSHAWQEGNPHFQANIALGNRYTAVRNDRQAMLELIGEWKAQRV